MKDYTKARKEMEQLIEQNFTALPIVFENSRKKPINTPHITLTEIGIESTPMGMSEDMNRVDSILTVEIYTERGSGTQVASDAASKLAEVFEQYEGYLSFAEPILESVGPKEDTALYQHNLSIQYAYIYGQDDSSQTC